jgi:ClpP class serine protease
MYSKIGIAPTVMSAGKHKAELTEFARLGADARAYLQAEVNAMHTAFIAAVAAGRRVPAATVREQFGQGGIVNAQDAVRLGMADRLGGLDLAVGRSVALVRESRRPGSRRGPRRIRITCAADSRSRRPEPRAGPACATQYTRIHRRWSPSRSSAGSVSLPRSRTPWPTIEPALTKQRSLTTEYF